MSLKTIYKKILQLFQLRDFFIYLYVLKAFIDVMKIQLFSCLSFPYKFYCLLAGDMFNSEFYYGNVAEVLVNLML